jgi:hypothetical protein
MSGSTAWAELEINNRLPCPNGACVPNRMTFGYYPTRWRRWPVTTAAPAGADAAARQGIQVPATSEPPPVAEDEVRSPFERLPRQSAPAPEEAGEFEPMPRPQGDEPANGGEENGGDRQEPGPRRSTPRQQIFQPPRGNPLPPSRRPINDGARRPSDGQEVGPLALDPPARLVAPMARPVSYAAGAAKQPAKLDAVPAGRKLVPTASGRSSTTNPLRNAAPAAARGPRVESPSVDEPGDDDGPQIVPTAAWIEEAAAAPTDAAPVKAQWRANPLRSR